MSLRRQALGCRGGNGGSSRLGLKCPGRGRKRRKAAGEKPQRRPTKAARTPPPPQEPAKADEHKALLAERPGGKWKTIERLRDRSRKAGGPSVLLGQFADGAYRLVGGGLSIEIKSLLSVGT